MNSRDTKGRYVSKGNIFETKEGLIYCYNTEGELLFFTDDMRVKDHCWGKSANGYSATHIDGKQITAHRFINGTPHGMVADHINQDKRDNRKCNLRSTNKSINAFNSKKRTTNTSGVTGVWFRKDTKKWVAEIKKDNKKHTIGHFKTFEEAVKVRKMLEGELYGN